MTDVKLLKIPGMRTYISLMSDGEDVFVVASRKYAGVWIRAIFIRFVNGGKSFLRCVDVPDADKFGIKLCMDNDTIYWTRLPIEMVCSSSACDKLAFGDEFIGAAIVDRGVYLRPGAVGNWLAGIDIFFCDKDGACVTPLMRITRDGLGMYSMVGKDTKNLEFCGDGATAMYMFGTVNERGSCL
jgi:hypothetical protein